MCCFSDAFDFDYGVGILRTPERLFQEQLDIQIEEENAQQDDLVENNYDGESLNIHFALIVFVIISFFSC